MHLFESPQHNQPEVEGKPEILEGSVHRLVYHNTDNGYTVLRMLHNDREITAVGSTLGITEGESIRLHGSWVKDPRYGRQFSFDRYEMVRPALGLPWPVGWWIYLVKTLLRCWTTRQTASLKFRE